MRTALIPALKRSADGSLRAALPLAGRSVLARQVDLLRTQGCEQILCLCERVDDEILQVQAAVEASGGKFQALRGFLHLPALIRAEDELVVLADGLVPDPGLVRDLFSAGSQPPRFVACLPTASLLVSGNPDDFERIDAERHWAGLLAMRGAPVQQLADFPPDSDAVSLLLRLALQAGTPCRELPDAAHAPGMWLLADGSATLDAQGDALILAAAGTPDWRTPSIALARLASRTLAPRGLEQGPGVAAIIAALLLLGGIATAASGPPAIGLGLAACGLVAAAFAHVLSGLRRHLLGEGSRLAFPARAAWVVDILAAIALLLALSPEPATEPLAMLGPVTIGLARLFALVAPSSLLATVADRGALLAGLALAAAFGFLPHATALVAVLLLGGLLLRREAI